MILVDTDAICAAIKDVFEDTRSILEPAGALAVAGAKAYARAPSSSSGKTLVAIASGANMNFDRLRFVAERAEIGEKREAMLAVTIPETPGSFREFCSLLGTRNITEFNYRYADPKAAHVFVGVQVQRPRRKPRELVAQAATQRADDARPHRQRNGQAAHAPHWSAATRPACKDEILYRFEFPERPGALMNFLNSMSHGWNISLFHYRNHGADYGRVLVGMQVPPRDKRKFRRSSPRSAIPATRKPTIRPTGCSWADAEVGDEFGADGSLRVWLPHLQLARQQNGAGVRRLEKPARIVPIEGDFASNMNISGACLLVLPPAARAARRATTSSWRARGVPRRQLPRGSRSMRRG